ncbi:MAG: hypothetical protein KC503_20820 [Myxococcales bacterium]|nr:hypothetical protein [Myxococcales bacterium]
MPTPTAERAAATAAPEVTDPTQHAAVGALEPAFVEDALYLPEALLFDEILAVDVASQRVRVRMPTHADLPLTNLQRDVPPKHPRHVSGGLMVHLTGMVAFVHFYYVLGLRIGDGWSGFGVRIHGARYPRLTTIGPPLELECEATRVRRLGGKLVIRYAFRFYQNDELVYEGDQTAMWVQEQA